MADFTSPFWSAFIGSVTVISIIALLWFVYVQSSARPPKDPDNPETMGHTWDGDLAEYNNPMPRWWLNLFYITLFWGAGYLIAYPGLGSFAGLLGWSQQGQYEKEMAKAEETYGPLFEKYKDTEIPALVKDEAALAMGQNLYASYCTQCHGSDAGGARGFPSLTDADWQWGGEPQAIKTSILNGRIAAMPGWTAIIGEDGVEQASDYVEHLAGREVAAAKVEAGKTVYNTNCAVCHGAEGKGNPMLGAPNLADDIWLYGGTRARIVESIAKGRNGQMPAHQEFLGEAKSHLLAAYVYSFSQGNTPTR
ncbi:MAG: cytochrome-c oxidase, cbb3-type subunit III [Gammaproteobacteria bacterium]